MKTIRWIYILFLGMTISSIAYAQEFNAKVTVVKRIQQASSDVFTSMETDISQLLNDQKWTDATFDRNERIECTVTISVNELSEDNKYKADIQLTSRRPIYNSSYITPTLNIKDSKFEFAYTQGLNLFYNPGIVDNNLVATLAFYAYIMLGLDFDSFSLEGGQPYFAKALQIANSAQNLQTDGWEPFSGKYNRHDLAIAFTDAASKNFHNLWYTYHRKGLDEMAANPSRGRINIIESINDLQKLYDARPQSPLIILFGETKLEELIKICSQATAEEKKTIKKTLLQIYPTKGIIINSLQ